MTGSINSICVILLTIMLHVQICWAFIILVFLPFRNRMNATVKIILLRFAIIVLPLLIVGITLFSYSNDETVNPPSIVDAQAEQKELAFSPLAQTMSNLSESDSDNPAFTVDQKLQDENRIDENRIALAQRIKIPAIQLALPGGLAIVMIFVWISGAALLLCNSLVKRYKTRRLLESAYVNTQREWKDALAGLNQMGYSCRGWELVSVPSWNGSPFSYGCFRPSIIVPENALSWSRGERQALLLHELQHINGHDLIIGLALDIMHALFWPCIGKENLARQLELAQEERCDLYAVRSSCHPIEYAKLLLELAYSQSSFLMPGAQGATQCVAHCATGKSSITRRIHMIISNLSTPEGKKKRRLFSALSFLALIIAVAALIIALPQVHAQAKGGAQGQYDESISLENIDRVELRAISTGEKRLLTAADLPYQHESITVPKAILPALWPIADGLGHVSMGFGENINVFSGEPWLHLAMDISTYRAGDPVLATMDSRVFATGFNRDFGYYVALKVKNVLVFYAHLKEFSVKEGETVQAGTVVGRIGNTGITTGPHLHYGILICDDAVSPGLVLITETEESLVFPSGYWVDPVQIIGTTGR